MRENVAKARIVIGLDSVSPYSNDIGSKSGDERANAKIVPIAIPLLRSCLTIGITPSEQPGNSIPITHD